MIRRPPRSTLSSSSAASDVYKRQDGIGGLGHQGGVARAQQHPHQMGEALFGADGHERLALGVDLDVEAALVPVGERQTQLGDAARRRVPVVAGFCAACVSLSTIGCAVGRSGLPMPRSMMSSPPVSYTHLRAHETPEHLVCRLLLEK